MERSADTSYTPTGAARARHMLWVGVAAFVAVLAWSLPTSGAAPTTPPESARAGAAWLRAQLDEQIPLDLFGSPDWGVTIDAATALASLDRNDAAIGEVWTAVLANREAVVTSGGTDVPGALAKVILLAHSLGKDPRSVGSAPGSDLVQRLVDTMGPDGLFGTQFAGYDGVYRQGLALAALGSADVVPDPQAISWLLDQQCTNAGFEGAFMPYRADTSIDCSDDPGAWLGADTNSTALALSGLLSIAADGPNVPAAADSALAWLAEAQQADGGWSANSWTDTDPNSTAVVIQALIAAGRLDEGAFNGGALTPQAFLMQFQMDGSEEPTDAGSFSFSLAAPSPNVLATVQAVVALASKPVVFDAPVPTPDQTTTTTTTTTSTTTTPIGGSGTGPSDTDDDGVSGAGGERPIRVAG